MKSFLQKFLVFFTFAVVVLVSSCDKSSDDSTDALLLYLLLDPGTSYFYVYNNTGYYIYYVYNVSHNAAWGSDFLGSSTIRPGYDSYTYSVKAGYRDFKAVDERGYCSYNINSYYAKETTYRLTVSSWGSCTYSAPGQEGAENCGNVTIEKMK